jgi:Glycosyl transferase 4-like domain
VHTNGATSLVSDSYMTKKILLISYYFPPNAEVGGLRIANFVRRLPRFGWDPYVLTIKDRYIENIDPEKLNIMGPVKIIKAGFLPNLSDVYLDVKKTMQRLRPRPVPSGNRLQAPDRSLGLNGQAAESLSGRLRRYALSFLMLPDSQRRWIWPAVVKAVCLIRRERVDAILTSCPPYSAHLVGLLTKQITGVQWIADFRDPWMASSSKALYSTCAASLKIERWLEGCVVRKADLVLANTQMLRDAFRKKYGACPPEHFSCITNGFDGEFFSDFENLEKEKLFTVTYAGTLYLGRTPEPIFRAVHELIMDGCIAPEAVCIRLVGHCAVIDGRPIEEIIERYHLGGVVEVLEPVSYTKAIEMVKRSHLALLLAPNQPYQIPAKVYDYMGTKTRVLALAEEGATSDLIRSTGIGGVFRPGDIAGIKDFINASFISRNAGAGLTHETVNRFEINSLTRDLVDYLDLICMKAEEAQKGSPRLYSTARWD